jgi:Putative Ig domain
VLCRITAPFILFIFSGTAVFFFSGCDARSSGRFAPLVVPQINYATATAAYSLWKPIAANSPLNAGTAGTEYFVNPDLPEGLTLDPGTGVISGTPMEVAAPATYMVTAFNPAGTTDTTLTMTVSLEESDLVFRPFTISPPTSSLQGWATDGTYNYTFDTQVIYKRNNDANWSIVTSNSSPFAGLTPGIDHLGDGEYYDGKVYLPAESYGFAGTCTFRFQTLAVYSATDKDLPLIHSRNISADGHEVSGVAVVPEQNALYVSSFCDGSKLWIYDSNSLTLTGTLSLSQNIPYIQGVSYNPATNSLFITADNSSPFEQGGEIYRVSLTGTVTPVYAIALPSEVEGLDFTQNSLGYMIDEQVYFLADTADPVGPFAQ